MSPTVSFAVGSHSVTLDVTDDEGATDSDTVMITVNSPVEGDVGITKTQQSGDSGWTTGPLTAALGDTVSYMLTITNTFENAVDLMIHDALSGLVESVGSLLGAGVVYDVGDSVVDTVDVDDMIFSTGWWYYGLESDETLTISFDVIIDDEFLGSTDWWIENVAWFDAYIDGEMVIENRRSNTVRVEAVPEPATLFFFGIGLIGILALRRKRNQ